MLLMALREIEKKNKNKSVDGGAPCLVSHLCPPNGKIGRNVDKRRWMPDPAHASKSMQLPTRRGKVDRYIDRQGTVRQATYAQYAMLRNAR